MLKWSLELGAQGASTSRRLRQEEPRFLTSLGNTVRPHCRKKLSQEIRELKDSSLLWGRLNEEHWSLLVITAECAFGFTHSLQVNSGWCLRIHLGKVFESHYLFRALQIPETNGLIPSLSVTLVLWGRWDIGLLAPHPQHWLLDKAYTLPKRNYCAQTIKHHSLGLKTRLYNNSERSWVEVFKKKVSINKCKIVRFWRTVYPPPRNV